MRKLVFGLAALMFAIVVLYFIGVMRSFPTWADRGLFGDTFGALNTIFSGVALVGIVIALYLQQTQLLLQKEESNKNIKLLETQIQQMQDAFKLQYQPVLQIDFQRSYIDRPSIFNMPRGGVSALSRYFFEFTISNVSDTPATDVIVTSYLRSSSKANREELKPADEHFPLVSNKKDISEHLMFVPDSPWVTFLEALREEDASRIPVLNITIIYRNLVGAFFYASESFHILKDSSDDTIGAWENEIGAFSDNYKAAIRELDVLSKDYMKWRSLFDELKDRFASKFYDQKEVPLKVVPIPGAYKIKLLTNEEHKEFLKQVGFGRITFPHTECVIEEEEGEGEEKTHNDRQQN